LKTPLFENGLIFRVYYILLICTTTETVLADEDQEQDSDRWCSHTSHGQEFWQILAQWVWNLCLELGQKLSSSEASHACFEQFMRSVFPLDNYAAEREGELLKVT
jgi:hypothetical protein